jgi:cytidine deaminase
MEKYGLSKKQIYKLIDLAFEARRNAYVPYSNYYVGAALLTKSGSIYKGCNVESCSYTPTTCAERVAVLKAVSEGEREFIAIAVVGGMGLDAPPSEEGAPCGVCRQLIYEFGSDTLIIGAKSKEEYYMLPISDLLPKGFGPQNLV